MLQSHLIYDHNLSNTASWIFMSTRSILKSSARPDIPLQAGVGVHPLSDVCNTNRTLEDVFLNRPQKGQGRYLSFGHVAHRTAASQLHTQVNNLLGIQDEGLQTCTSQRPVPQYLFATLKIWHGVGLAPCYSLNSSITVAHWFWIPRLYTAWVWKTWLQFVVSMFQLQPLSWMVCESILVICQRLAPIRNSRTWIVQTRWFHLSPCLPWRMLGIFVFPWLIRVGPFELVPKW